MPTIPEARIAQEEQVHLFDEYQRLLDNLLRLAGWRSRFCLAEDVAVAVSAKRIAADEMVLPNHANISVEVFGSTLADARKDLENLPLQLASDRIHRARLARPGWSGEQDQVRELIDMRLPSLSCEHALFAGRYAIRICFMCAAIVKRAFRGGILLFVITGNEVRQIIVIAGAVS